jgi:hypothetical protein
MSGWLFALILASVITILSVITEKNQNRQINLYAAKTFIICFVVVYFGWTFLMQECDVIQEINTGDPPF